MFSDSSWALCGISGALFEVAHELENGPKDTSKKQQQENNCHGLRHLSLTVPAHAGHTGKAS
jgi:hypothetical protein